MKNYREVVKGRIVSAEDGHPIAGAEVEVYDKDMLISDHLGTDTTSKAGLFLVPFRWSDFKDSPFEDRPDIFVKVKNPVSGKTTKSKVFYELSGDLAEDDSEEILDLGDIAVD